MKDLSYFYPKTSPKPITYSRYRKVYKVVHDANGNKRFEQVGQTDLFALTQSFKESCSIENIIKRASNDPSVLHRTVGQYMDLTKVPTTMQDCFEVINNAQKVFENLPMDQRNTYNNNFASFLGDFKTATGLARFVDSVKANNKKVESEVSVDA